jgi:hypothetical protein
MKVERGPREIPLAGLDWYTSVLSGVIDDRQAWITYHLSGNEWVQASGAIKKPRMISSQAEPWRTTPEIP